MGAGLPDFGRKQMRATGSEQVKEPHNSSRYWEARSDTRRYLPTVRCAVMASLIDLIERAANAKSSTGLRMIRRD
jgi:hypothetical protein